MAMETYSPPGVAAPGKRARSAVAKPGGLQRLRASVTASVGRLRVITAPAAAVLRRLAAPLQQLPIGGFLTGSLVRRILVSHLIGLLLLVGGMVYLSRNHVFLIEAKRDSLKVQGELLAAAIAANAVVDEDRIVIDAGKLLDGDSRLVPFRDDGLSALELSIRPDRIAPLLRRLIQPTSNTRARIYGRDGSLIVDSQALFTRGQIARSELGNDTSSEVKPRPRNFWTRLIARSDRSELPVYRDIGTANGKAYSEVNVALNGTTSQMLLLTKRGELMVSMAIPIQRLMAVHGVLLLSTRPGEFEETMWQELRIILGLVLLALTTTLVSSLLLARTIAGPMRRLSESAEAVARNINARTELPRFEGRADEVGQMARAFGQMTDALYRRAEASESFAADVAHELKNPLTAARSTAESLVYAKTDLQRQRLVETISEELKRLNRLITDVSNASRLNAELAMGRGEPVDLKEVIDGIVGVLRDGGGLGDVALAIDLAPTARGGRPAYFVNGHAGRIGQVLTNLVDNAVSFSPEGGKVTVRLRRVGPEVEIAVEDEGAGLPADKLEKVFERFYTDRPQSEAKRGKNSGLGLSISKDIVLAHQGRIWAENREPPAKGARFVVRLPAGRAGPRRPPRIEASAA